MNSIMTLLLANFLLFALYVTAIQLTWRSYGELRGSRWFALSNALRGLVMLGFMAQSFHPKLHVSVVANGLVLLGLLTLHRAFAELLDEPRSFWRSQVAIACAGVAAMVAVRGMRAPDPWFLGVMSTAMCAMLLLLALMLLRCSSLREKRVVEGFLAALLAGYGLLAMYRAGQAIYVLSGFGTINLGRHVTLWLLASLVVNAGTAFGFVLVASVELARQLEERAQTDALTGLRNRHGLEARMAQIAADPSVKTVSVIALDIDKMKQANDRWGHEFGDDILRAVAGTLRQVLRPGKDIGVRLGGDEFLLLLTNQDAAEAAVLSEQLRLAVGEIRSAPESAGHHGGMHGSFGVACLSTESSRPLPWEQLFRDADEAMYRAKREGRDRVWMAEAE